MGRRGLEAGRYEHRCRYRIEWVGIGMEISVHADSLNTFGAIKKLCQFHKWVPPRQNKIIYDECIE